MSCLLISFFFQQEIYNRLCVCFFVLTFLRNVRSEREASEISGKARGRGRNRLAECARASAKRWLPCRPGVRGPHVAVAQTGMRPCMLQAAVQRPPPPPRPVGDWATPVGHDRDHGAQKNPPMGAWTMDVIFLLPLGPFFLWMGSFYWALSDSTAGRAPLPWSLTRCPRAHGNGQKKKFVGQSEAQLFFRFF